MNKYLVKLGSEMSGGRYFEAVPPVQFQDTPQIPIVTKEKPTMNKYISKIEKSAATALSKRVNDKTKGSRLNVESPMGNHVPSSTLNKSLNSGKVDPLTQPLAQRLADRKQAISLKNGGGSPFKDGKGKADQIHNAKTLRQGGNTGAFDNHPNNFGRTNAANIESALKDSKAGHTASLKFNQSGSTSFASTAPEVKAPQSLGARIMARLKTGAGSAAAHVRGKVSAMARTPMGKIGLGVGAVAAAGIGAKAMSGPKQEEQPYYSQGYGL